MVYKINENWMKDTFHVVTRSCKWSNSNYFCKFHCHAPFEVSSKPKQSSKKINLFSNKMEFRQFRSFTWETCKNIEKAFKPVWESLQIYQMSLAIVSHWHWLKGNILKQLECKQPNPNYFIICVPNFMVLLFGSMKFYSNCTCISI